MRFLTAVAFSTLIASSVHAADLTTACESARQADEQFTPLNEEETERQMATWVIATQSEISKGAVIQDAGKTAAISTDIMTFGTQIFNDVVAHKTLTRFIQDACD
ncbi:hypothetical protein [Beijerinckia sp. L45]|uniref:hypothetical protein n=1 Tax=Beijerinckia sp. L45 TaxID=1641855 RepID=UPI00131D0CB6|nr:hypothetical protein [Beijerinckia sp. L45]